MTKNIQFNYSKISILLGICIILCIIIIIYQTNNNDGFTLNENTRDIDVYVINLDKDKDRLQKLEKYIKLNNNNINIIRYPGILGKDINKDHELFKKYLSPDYKADFNYNSTIGCALSHITLYNMLYQKFKNDTSQEYFIIAEDDAIFVKDFNSKLNIVLNELPSDWDFIYLGSSKPVGKKYSTHLIKPEFKEGGNWGFFGYMLSKKGLSKIVKYSRLVDKPIDNFLKNTDLNYFIANPTIIKHDFDNVSNLTGISRKNDGDSYNIVKIID